MKALFNRNAQASSPGPASRHPRPIQTGRACCCPGRPVVTVLVKVTADVVHAHPARVLASLSAREDLVVIGKHQAGGHAVGSIQNAVLSHAHGPVAIVPSTA